MFDMRDFSNTSIALIVIIVLSSAVAVRALTIPVDTKQPQYVPRVLRQVEIDPNMAFNIVPSNLTVAVGDEFAVTVFVMDATNMFGWQIYLCYDPTSVQCLGASFQPGYVFSDYLTVSGALREHDPAKFHGDPIQGVRNDEGWMVAGDCLLGLNQPMFNGSGPLCQIEFRVISGTSSILALRHDPGSVFQTFNMRPDISTVTSPSNSYTRIDVVPN
jgi:hypothetical protein